MVLLSLTRKLSSSKYYFFMKKSSPRIKSGTFAVDRQEILLLSCISPSTQFDLARTSERNALAVADE